MAQTTAAVGGHVNMMMDVLIAQLPPTDLRAACRRILSEHPSLASVLRDVVYESRSAEPLALPDQKALLPDSKTVTPDLLQCMLDFRIDFLAGLHARALQRTTYLVDALLTASHERSLKPEEPLQAALKRANGDIIQYMQAIKESATGPDFDSSAFKSALHELWTKLGGLDASFGLDRAWSQTRDTYALLFPNDALLHVPHMDLLHQEVDMSSYEATIPTITLGPIEMPRLLIGFWQLSSPAWGTASSREMQSSLLDLVSQGFRAADMADHYGDAEIIFGQFRRSLLKELNDQMITCTKWCVFAAPDRAPTSEWVASKVHERRDRCGGYLDVLQFHWQDYSDKSYLLIIHHLIALSRFAPHVVKAIGLVNFNAERTDEICMYLKQEWDGEGMVISNQVQYSLIDQRPRFALADVCKKHGIKLLTYGTYCGGFLSDKWLGKPSPNLYADSITPSQRKYFDMIMLWGGWTLFQELLAVLRGIANAHGGGVDIANVAAKWVLEKEEVASVIVGTRLGVSSNAESNLRVFSFSLTEKDRATINAVLNKSQAEEMFRKMGDCGAEYRHTSH
ncbi:putative aryl-alcohol dehydrogenase [Calocera cornea HHB12733]|uniref:Putative aryl-alcohol dehydrogenase n=1 Tax=Calocera cornea HHB12733 TaxID=1353952 RepID=A0A165EP44_9BASI|nr:putative aryl-alcohol dehydrogenase [Calocera cornea HHB12733]